MQSNSVRKSQESKAKVSYTSGPWSIHDLWPDDVVDAEGKLVVSAYGDYESPKTQANAHLIAAAPQLLESLEEFVALANFDADTIPKTTEEWDAMVAKAETVIRKAKGGQ